MIEPKDSVTIFRHKGDTIRHGDILATKTTPAFFEEQLALNGEKLGALTSQQAASLEDFERRIFAAELVLAIDSADYQHSLALVKNGYSSPGLIVASELKWQKEKDALRKLFSATNLLRREKMTLDIERLHLIDSQLRAKARAARLQSEIRSPIGGVLLEIRQMPQDNKTRLVFIIRRLP